MSTTSKIYTFQHNGQSFDIPSAAAIPVGVTRKSRHIEDEVDKFFTIMELTIGEESQALAAIDSMDAETFAEFLAGWTQGASLGESSSSES